MSRSTFETASNRSKVWHVYASPASSMRIFWTMKMATVLESSEEDSMILRHRGMISVVSRNWITSLVSFFTSAPITPSDVSRRLGGESSGYTATISSSRLVMTPNEFHNTKARSSYNSRFLPNSSRACSLLGPYTSSTIHVYTFSSVSAFMVFGWYRTRCFLAVGKAQNFDLGSLHVVKIDEEKTLSNVSDPTTFRKRKVYSEKIKSRVLPDGGDCNVLARVGNLGLQVEKLPELEVLVCCHRRQRSAVRRQAAMQNSGIVRTSHNPRSQERRVAVDTNVIVGEPVRGSDLCADAVGVPPSQRRNLRIGLDRVDPSPRGGVPEMDAPTRGPPAGGQKTRLGRAPCQRLDGSRVAGFGELRDAGARVPDIHHVVVASRHKLHPVSAPLDAAHFGGVII
ncbi:hypothetical protein OGATHE_003423 [Ogataea polymorpha]|uniref:Uncharacterized protein n=1 Tax=Ogataea polymorpha TaxID=460523 RepID=A0A9P8T376_9ASCO|nr:hypothetical protein OGATHE_003423 [Ogataea polymorpha]